MLNILKEKKLWLIVAAVCLAVCLCVVLVMCSGDGEETPTNPTADTTAAAKITYTLTVKSNSGMALEGIGVYVYTDSTQKELVWYAKTDAEGKMTFTDVVSDNYVAVLQDVPTGYKVEESYPITGEATEIVLSAASMEDGPVENLTYKLGDMMMDFSVTASDGTVYTLSELLKEKDAVVLNFWYTNCGPCKIEFPYLQEAYEAYSDRIEVLALNPVDSDNAGISAFQKDNGLTFPMAKVDESWAKIMQLTAYPTTVVVDRYGNITLIHKGSIDNAQTFKDVFAHFCAEEYEQKVIQDITEIETVAEEGTKENPTELGGVDSFEVTLAPGQVAYIDLYKVNDMYLRISSSDAYVLFNDKTYQPSSGVVSVLLSCPDTSSPAKIGIGNSSDRQQTFKATLVMRAGIFSNPYSLKLGEFSASVSSGNDQGVYYSYRAPEDGVLTMQCLSSSVAGYGYYLYNLDSGAMRNLESDSQTDANGVQTVSIEARKGQTVLFSVSTLPDDSGNYPSGSFKFNAVFTGSELKEEVVIEKATYTVTVTDSANAPVPNVTVWVTNAENKTESLQTDENGVVSLELNKGTYTVKLTVPEGYLLETNRFDLTEEVLSLSIQLQKEAVVEMKDYTVTVVNKAGQPVPGVKLGIGQQILTTDEAGKAVFNLEYGTYDAAVFAVPRGYEASQSAYSFEELKTEMTIVLDYGLGSEQKPIDVKDMTAESFATDALNAQDQIYYSLYYTDATVTIEDADAVVIYNGESHTADEATGIVTVVLAPNNDPAKPTVIGFMNGGEAKESYTVNLSYPAGSIGNPDPLSKLSVNQLKLPARDTNGHCYSYPASGKGTMSFWMHGTTSCAYDIILYNADKTAKLSEVTDVAEGETKKVSIAVEAEDVVTIQVIILPDEAGNYPEAETRFNLRGSFTEAPVEDPEEDEDGKTDDPEQEPEYPAEMTYTVTVTDYTSGTAQPLTSDVYVYIKNDSTVVHSAILNADTPSVSVTLTTATYQVELAFPSGTARYPISTSVLTPAEPSLSIALAEKLGDTTTSKYWFGSYYDAQLGASYVKIDANQANYSVYNGVEYCFFILPITQDGLYTLTTTNSAELTYWGPNTQVIYNQGSTATSETGILSVNVKNSNLDNGRSLFVLSVTVTEDITDTILVLTRAGDAAYDVYDAPWTSFVGTQTPEVKYDALTGTAVPADPNAIFRLPLSSGQSLVYLDMSKTAEDYRLVKGSDGYYHLNSETGPILYVNLNYDRYVSLYTMINGSGNAGGTAFRKIFYNANGTPEQDVNGMYHKEDYTECMKAYTLHIDSTYGVCPVNDDLIYMLQNGGEYAGWYTYENENYLFDTANVDANIAWMFAFCYVG